MQKITNGENTDLNAKNDSKLYINSVTPEDNKAIEITTNKMHGVQDELPETKRSLEHKPSKIVVPDKDSIVEEPVVEEAKSEVKSEEGIYNTLEVNSFRCASEHISTVKTLNIEVVESPTVEFGAMLTITPKGLIGSKRNAQDGCTYFGTNPDENDYIISTEEIGFGEKHLVIQYDSNKKTYILKTLKDGTGTFIKISERMVIDSDIILSFTNLHLAIVLSNDKSKAEYDLTDTSLKESSSNTKLISIKLLNDPKTTT